MSEHVELKSLLHRFNSGERLNQAHRVELTTRVLALVDKSAKSKTAIVVGLLTHVVRMTVLYFALKSTATKFDTELILWAAFALGGIPAESAVSMIQKKILS